MPTAATNIDNGVPAMQDALHFKYLPAYAQFLLDHQLEEFSRYILQVSRELHMPLLRYFESMPEDQLLAMTLEGNRKLMEAFIDNSVGAYLDENLRSWKENQLPLIQGDDVVIEDITKVNFARRKAFRHFLPQYITEPAAYIGIMGELDLFILTQEETSYKTLFEMKEQKIREHHYFIDKIANTSPGILYVFDLQRKKQIYANHRQEEMLGYTSDDLTALTGSGTSITHPEDRPRVLQHYQDFGGVAEGEMRTIEYRVRDKQGEYHWQRGYEAVFKRTAEGIPCEIIGIAMDVTKEKEASIQLEQREAQLREAQELAGMGSFEWDMAGNQSILSPHLFRIFEMDDNTDLMAFLEYVHPSDRPAVKEAIADATNGNSHYECEFRYRRNGPEKVIWSRGKVTFEAGKAVKMKGTVMDVTLRHDMIKRLERSEQLHKQAQALTHIGNWSWSFADNKVEWSDEMYRIFGLVPQSEAMKLGRILALVHPDDRARQHAALHRALQTGQVDDYTMRVISNDGTVRYVEGKNEVLTDEAGKLYKIVGTCQDITRQHLLHEQIRENEEASRQLINNAPEAIVVIDEDSNILLWNPKAEVTFGWTSAEITGKTLADTIIPVEYRQQHLEGITRLRATGESRMINRTIEITALKKNGATLFASLNISRSVRAGKPVFIAFIRDISNEKATELKLLEQRNQLGQKNRELERSNQELMAFNYIASHDLQEPVRKIQIFSNLILANEKTDLLPKEVKDSVGRISASAEHMSGLIEALIAFSRTSNAERTFELTDLNATVTEVQGLLKDRITESGAVVTSTALPALNAIPFQMQQLFENIIGNALKYRKPDIAPQISITAQVVAGDALQALDADPDAAYCRISVTDNGIGFDQQYATRVFELFRRLHNKQDYSGTGIGLAICKKIVQNHDGYITATSSIGQGTTFDIFLPVDKI